MKYFFILYILINFSQNILLTSDFNTILYFFPIYGVFDIILSRPLFILLFLNVLFTYAILQYNLNIYKGIEYILLLHFCYNFITMVHIFLDFLAFLLFRIVFSTIFMSKNDTINIKSLRRSLRLASKPKINYKL